ncbi:MAG: Acetyl-coenzyme A synthetase [Verrucomicrobiae bacterium]|nr:Acetyl-coenzyme A synthetase [Verrucomicrobiae bacterium]
MIAQSNLQHFITRHGLASYDELLHRASTDVAWFWDAVLKELDVQFSRPYSKVVDLANSIALPAWCVDGEMNIVHNLLDKRSGPKVAVRWERENGQSGTLTYDELRAEVNRAATFLRLRGLGRGDVVGVFMPLTADCVVAMLAIIKIGGIFLPLFSGFGAQAIASRLHDAGAKALITVTGTYRRGQFVNMEAIAREATPNVILPDWQDQPAEAVTEPTGADEPMMLIYTSGTTGKPKGAVHTHCGFPIKAAQDMLHGLDLHPDETLFWVTDIGWMMGPWLIFGTLLLGGTMMIYDGALDDDRLWALCDRHQVTTLGVSPTLIRALARLGDEPVRKHDLSALRKFGSTGEPWNPAPWLWLFQVVGGGKLPIINYSGGTETSGGIVMGNVLSPLKPCAFAGPVVGMAADVVNERGESVRGEVGELVIRQPWIGMTRGFWNDRQRYLDTYWSRWPDVWVHGDWAAVDADGQWYILGRSDDTIKVAGKRLGPAEVESILVAHPAVSEAAAIGAPDELKGEVLVCFCVLKPGHPASAALRDELKNLLVASLGKPLQPKDLKFTRDIPKTRNAKIMRRLVRAAYLGEELKDTSALENRTALDAIRQAS